MTTVLTRPADEDHDDPRVVPPVPVVDGAAPEHHNCTDAASHWGAMSLTPDDLAAAGRALVGRVSRLLVYFAGGRRR